MFPDSSGLITVLAMLLINQLQDEKRCDVAMGCKIGWLVEKEALES
jgi:hypothetical protein